MPPRKPARPVFKREQRAKRLRAKIQGIEKRIGPLGTGIQRLNARAERLGKHPAGRTQTQTRGRRGRQISTYVTRRREHLGSISLTAHRLAKSAVNALSSNKNAVFCATPIRGATILRKKAVQRFAKIAHWEPVSRERRRIETERSSTNAPKQNEYWNQRRHGRAWSNWMKENAQKMEYEDKVVERGAGTVLLTKP